MKAHTTIVLAARLFSSIFRPIYYPLAGMALLLTCTYLSLLPWLYKLWLLTMVAFFTIGLPATATWLYRCLRGWSAQELRHQHKRHVPYLLYLSGTLVCLHLLSQLHLPMFVRAMFLISLALQTVCTIINVWWKISTHSAGSGAIIGALVAYAALFQFNPVWWLCLAILLNGAVNSSRMYLRQHTLWQVLCGTWVGFVCGLAGILLI